MTCPRCGSDVPSASERCPRCSSPLHVTVATGVLTPPPPPGSDDPTKVLDAEPETAVLGDGEATRVIDAETGAVDHTSINTDETRTVLPGSVPSDNRGPLTAGQKFGARYHIIRALGVGGMGAVYQAFDTELGVAVAIKVIRPEVMADPTAAADVERRFKRELVLAREVTHKNVVRIHDLGEINGIKYITMTYVDGSDLSTLLRREGTLLVPSVLRIARAVVSGLVEAHKAGVVHRDLKPANIMIDKAGDALIMDFGIARSAGGRKLALPEGMASAMPASVSQTAFTADATTYGTVVGTVEYMAPEQAQGHDVDQRADIYALGLMLYDMLVGRQRRARGTDSAIAELKSRMVQAPPPLKSIRPEIPDAVDQLIAKCLEPDPAKRFQTSQDLADELSRLDQDGHPIPEARRFTPRMIAAGALLVAALIAGTWWLTRTPPLPKQHDPISVLIADFQNQTGDATFERSLESVLKLALEGAGFITAYDRTGLGGLGTAVVPKLDERTAQQIAVKQGVGVVVSGVLTADTLGYGISIKAIHPVSGSVMGSANARASNKEGVLPAATKLATSIRQALGDETSSAVQLFGLETLSTSSLPVVRQYALASEALASGKYEEALQGFSKAVEMDPTFGIAYHGMATVSRNLDRPQDAEKYIREALRHVDRMTERERYRTRGLFYRITGDYQACVKEYGELVTKFAADVPGHNQVALCASNLRNLPKAVEEMRTAVKIVPQAAIFRGNLALYEAYSGDFQAAEEQARLVREPRWFSVLAEAFGQLGQGKLPETTATYRRLALLNAQGASYATMGLADLALYEGRFTDAIRLLESGAAADVAGKNPERAAVKQLAASYAYLARGQNGPAVTATEKALANSQTVRTRFLAARSFVEAGQIEKARAIADAMASEIKTAPSTATEAHLKIIEASIASKAGDATQAIKLLTDANNLLDTWIAHFDLGRAYLDIRQFIQADSEFDRCLKRRGEALSLFLDEHPTYAYLPPVYFYQGRVREGLNSAGFADSYRAYLKIRGESTEDPLLPDARKRAGV